MSSSGHGPHSRSGHGVSHGPSQGPVNPLPPAVWLLFLVMVGVELAFQLGTLGLVGGPQAVGWRLEAVERFTFSGEIFDWMWQSHRWPAEHLVRFVTYPFVNASMTQMLIAGVMFLAMAKMVAEAMGQVVMLVIFFASAILGATAYALLTEGPMPLLGAFPPVYGLIGAFTWMLWRRLSAVGENQARAFSLIGFLMGIQLIFGLFFDNQNDWVADLAGFFTGFALSYPLAPGGWTKVLRRLRQE